MTLNVFLRGWGGGDGGGWSLAGRPFNSELKMLGEGVGYCQSLPSDLLLGLAIVFIEECNPFQNSFEVTDVSF